ncbi:MAG: 50S ribosomal protein L18 [Patescibacteria group bacterium]
MKKTNFEKRRERVRAKIIGSEKRPRLSVYRSNKSIFCQIVDDSKGKTFVSASLNEIKEGKTKTEKSALLGELIAKKALAKKIKKVVFDKSGYKFHGRVKALAEGARKGGLIF